MQQEIGDTAFILGVGAAGMEDGNATITKGRSLPWLQDDTETNAWGLWHVTWRDVVILDRQSRVQAVYNLTEHDLELTADYETLIGMIEDAAAE